MIFTDRLHISEFSLTDAPFILQLVNCETWLQFIGDRNIHSVSDAENYLKTGPLKSYDEHGYGLWKVRLLNSDTCIGMCGFVKRDALPHPDIGFALLPAFERKGYALEAAKACLKYGAERLSINKVVAITDQTNKSSQRLLRKLGLSHSKNLRLQEQGQELMFFE